MLDRSLSRSFRGPLLACLAFVLAFGVSLASAKTVHVRSWEAGGRDWKSGANWSNAMFSLTAAFNKCGPGDRVLIEPGTYYYGGTEKLTRSGNNSNWINVEVASRTYNGQTKVIIDSRNHNGDALEISGNYIWINGQNNSNYHGLQVRNSKSNGIKIVSRNNRATHHVTIRNVDVRNSTYAGIVSSRGKENNFQNRTGPKPYRLRILNSNVTNNCRINSDRSASSAWPGAIAIFESGDVRVENTNIFKNYGEGMLFMGSTDCWIQNSYVGNNFSANVYFDNVVNGKCRYNNIGGNLAGYRKGNTTYGANGVVIANEQQFYTRWNPFQNSRNIEVRGNDIYDCGYGFWFWRDWGNNAITVQNNKNELTNTTLQGNSFSRNFQNKKIDDWGNGNNIQ